MNNKPCFFLLMETQNQLIGFLFHASEDENCMLGSSCKAVQILCSFSILGIPMLH